MEPGLNRSEFYCVGSPTTWDSSDCHSLALAFVPCHRHELQGFANRGLNLVEPVAMRQTAYGGLEENVHPTHLGEVLLDEIGATPL
ncbi:hypothetical protein IAQ61_002969 [Plenodomus lingam]|uniref:uncharacterized protein n=1 Tax=Leptosphaeria maculans TaxID=5022 RepID=UPI0033262A98|nr:hypothetical protein IAQ61_002969 [Plenodomus lingam]